MRFARLGKQVELRKRMKLGKFGGQREGEGRRVEREEWEDTKVERGRERES